VSTDHRSISKEISSPAQKKGIADVTVVVISVDQLLRTFIYARIVIFANQRSARKREKKRCVCVFKNTLLPNRFFSAVYILLLEANTEPHISI
jgi:hypothetical protein